MSVQSFQFCPTLWGLMDCSPPDSSVHGTFQERTLEWGAMPSSRGSSQPPDWTASFMSPALAAGSLPLEPAGKAQQGHYIHFSSVTRSSLPLCDPMTAAYQASLSITNSWSLLKLMSIEKVMPSDHLILCHPLSLLPSIFPSIRVFSNELVICNSCEWSFSFSIRTSNSQDWFPLGLIDWISLQSKGLSRVFCNTTVQKHQFSTTQFSLWYITYLVHYIPSY